jgi:hypothetical protein
MAVDWSGALKGASKHIWLAEVVHGQIVRLEDGWTREGLINHLIEQGRNDLNVIVGIDFAFSMPGWFVESRGAKNGPEFWENVATEGETWLGDCPWPFWGKHEAKRPKDVELFRSTEKLVRDRHGVQAFSTFQMIGRGNVSTGSIRGMPLLRQLRTAGWRVWPFDQPGFPMVIEIFPTLLTDPKVTKLKLAPDVLLANEFPELSSKWIEIASSSDDAFDAAVSALVMARHVDGLCALPDLTKSSFHQLEGWIWDPRE